jgi:hypothetical protein
MYSGMFHIYRAAIVIGHCGWCGIGGVVVFVIISNLSLALVSMGIVISFYTSSGEYTTLAAPYIYDGVGPFFWGSAALAAAVGGLVLVSTNEKMRKAFLTVWTILMFIYAGSVIAYGVHVVMRFRDLYTILPDLLDVLQSGGALLLEKAGINMSDKLAQKLSKGGSIFTLVESVSAATMMHIMPYPFDFLLFLGHRPDVASVIYVILPGAFAILSLPVVMAIRNYFQADHKGVVKHRERYEGVPLHHFMCGSYETEAYDCEAEEEDLASTFDGSSGDPDENESLLESGSDSVDSRRNYGK